MKTRPQVSIIVLNYNAAAFLPKTLDSIKMQKGITTQTILVDNNSSDHSLAIVKKDYPWVKVVKRNTSTGFAAGNNAGLPVALSDTILFFNPDIAFTKSTDLKKCYDKYYAT
ncbi:MAG: glycosyltransferase, partial [bacterium]